ncbi:MAG TPA: TetR/AcrR family transcriptional regulator [Rhodanobacteraceae bacterium]|nr:TetR/AcrR family transcriptional regulator [Rhodanobacteraceae bacterium]
MRTVPPSALRRILAAAERLFAERGFDGVSIADIARDARVSKANVFHHFAGKQALYERVLAGACARLDAGAASTSKAEADSGPAVRIARAVAGCRDALHAHPSMRGLLLHELARSDRSEAGPVPAVLARLREDFVAELQQARDRGELRIDADTGAAASMLLGVLLFGTAVALARATRADDDSRTYAPIDALLDCLLRSRVA